MAEQALENMTMAQIEARFAGERLFTALNAENLAMLASSPGMSTSALALGAVHDQERVLALTRARRQGRELSKQRPTRPTRG